MKETNSTIFSAAFRGIWETLRNERNFKIHLAIALATIGVGFWMELTASAWRWISLCIALMLIMELVNTAIETVVDLASPAYHPLAKKAKDIAAGAVLLAAIFAAGVGASILGPKLWAYFLD